MKNKPYNPRPKIQVYIKPKFDFFLEKNADRIRNKTGAVII